MQFMKGRSKWIFHFASEKNDAVAFECKLSKKVPRRRVILVQHAAAAENVRNHRPDSTPRLVATRCKMGDDCAAAEECRAGRGSVTRRPDSRLGI